MTPVKELSGLFMSSERWHAALLSLQQPALDVSHVRLFHNTAHQVAELLAALANAAPSTEQRIPLSRLFIGDLDPAGAEALAAFLARPNCTLRVLELQHLGGSCEGAGGGGGGSSIAAAQALAPGLRAAPALAELHLQRCHGDGALAVLAQALGDRAPHATTPMQLGLQHCRFDASAAAVLGNLAAAGATPALSFSSCHLTDPTLKGFLNVMQQPLFAKTPQVPLQSLNLTGNAIGPCGAAALATLLPHAPCLTTLILEGNTALADDGAAALASGAARAPSLMHLDLSNCGITAAGAAALARALGAGAALRRLRLDHNAIGADGLLALTAAIHLDGCPLRELCAEACHIGGARLAAVGDQPPPAASPLHVLRLGGNALGDAGAAWVVQMLLGGAAGSRALTDLELCDGDIGDTGAEHLAAMLAASAQLQSLLLARNRLQDRGSARLCAAAAKHAGLRSFSIKGCMLTGMAMRARAAEVSGLIAQRPTGCAASGCPRDAAGHSAEPQPTPPPGASLPGTAVQRGGSPGEHCGALGASSARPGASVSPPPDAMDSSDDGGTSPVRGAGPGGDGAAAGPKPQAGAGAGAGAATKHRLEPDLQELRTAKLHHVQEAARTERAAGGVPAPDGGCGGDADAAWLPSSWRSECTAAARDVAGREGRAFSGCSASSFGGAAPTPRAPGAAAPDDCVAYVCRAGGKGGDGGSTGDSGMGAKPPVSDRGSAGRKSSESGGSGDGGAERSSDCASGVRAYSRRFRPLSQEQQLLFADF